MKITVISKNVQEKYLYIPEKILILIYGPQERITFHKINMEKFSGISTDANVGGLGMMTLEIEIDNECIKNLVESLKDTGEEKILENENQVAYKTLCQIWKQCIEEMKEL